MDEETKKILQAQQIKIEEIYKSVEKTRKYILTSFIISVVVFVLPLIGLIIVVPMVLGTLTSSYEALL